MSPARAAGPGQRQGIRGGLPDEDEELSAFAAAAAAASGPSAAVVPLLTPALAPAVPQPARDEPPAPSRIETQRAGSEPGTAISSPQGEPDALPDVPYGDLVRQATVSVSAAVAERFRAYRRSESQHGPQPSNAQVIFRALREFRGRYAEVVIDHLPHADPDFPFGGPAAGRRRTSEGRLTSQINFRPTVREYAGIEERATNAGAPSVSFFIDSLLDAFLPQMPGRVRGVRRPG